MKMTSESNDRPLHLTPEWWEAVKGLPDVQFFGVPDTPEHWSRPSPGLTPEGYIKERVYLPKELAASTRAVDRVMRTVQLALRAATWEVADIGGSGDHERMRDVHLAVMRAHRVADGLAHMVYGETAMVSVWRTQALLARGRRLLREVRRTPWAPWWRQKALAERVDRLVETLVWFEHQAGKRVPWRWAQAGTRSFYGLVSPVRTIAVGDAAKGLLPLDQHGIVRATHT